MDSAIGGGLLRLNHLKESHLLTTDLSLSRMLHHHTVNRKGNQLFHTYEFNFSSIKEKKKES